jgi:hypothetical protein
VFDAETTSFLEGGCALIIGTVAADGEPLGTRGWGLSVIGRDPPTIRLLLDADEGEAIDNLAATAAIAVTAADVRTFHSTQMKGLVIQIEPATDADRDRAVQYYEAFFADVARNDLTPRSLIDRMAPADFVVCTVALDDQYDQTPGPSAGARLEVDR